MNACKKDPSLAPPPPIQLEALVPSYFPSPYYKSDKNKLSQEGIKLGRKLFYDPMLSSTNTMSCGSCHKQEFAFSDAGNPTSPGEEGQSGERNSPPIFNMAWSTSFMWDGGITNLEIMPFAPITAPHEMNQDMKSLLLELKNDLSYQRAFKTAFGPSGITEVNFYYALAQFMSSMISTNAKYDQVKQGQTSFTIDESAGYQLFQQHCNQCHTEPLFTNQGFENNGLELVSKDAGRGRVTRDAKDNGKYKVPSLRNTMLTAPYMHDGRIASIEKVLAHYSDQIKPHPNLNPILQGGFQLSKREQKDIISFLETLTDYAFITNPNLAEPK